MRKTLLLLVLLFGVGVIASTQASVADHNPCRRLCHDEYREHLRRCQNVPPHLRDECRHEARQELEACIRRCN
jgi:hypothetical protein